jgi:sugar (pentulose or hexulose) kinase
MQALTGPLIGLDIGTSVTKAAVFDSRGRELVVASSRTEVSRPQPAWSEMDSEAVWRAVCTTCKAAVAKSGVKPNEIVAVGVTGVMVGAWLVDATGVAVRPAVLWDDGRARDWLERTETTWPNFLSEVFDRSGSVMQLGCTLPVLAWLAEQEPQSLARAAAVLTAKDFIRLRLTGAIGWEETEAAVAPGSAIARDFDFSLLPMFGLDQYRDLLPRVHRSETIAGTVTAAAASLTGLAEGTPVAFGAGDVPASVIGAGAGAPGLACTVLGTTCLNGLVVDKPLFEPRDLGLLFTLPGGSWMKTMVNVAGTTNIDWCLRSLCPDLAGLTESYDALASCAEAGGVGAGGVVYIPYLSASGIIAPRIESGARAGFFGCDPSHRREHLVRAIYEGVAFAIRECYAATGRSVEAVRLVGGGARSRFWVQMIADIVGVPVEIPVGVEFGAKGAALIASVAIHQFSSIAEACRESFVLDWRYEPNGALRDDYDAAYRRYRAASAASLDLIASAYR